MAKPEKQSPTTSATCVECRCELGDRAKVLPMTVREDDGDGAGKSENWCPQCFVYKRAPADSRWYHAVRLGQLTAVQCSACGIRSVDVGRRCCGQCNSRAVVVLGPVSMVQIASPEMLESARTRAGRG